MNNPKSKSQIKLPTICLNMIVKNESKVIERCLKSVLPIIDYYVIVDTGSTDKTKKIISKFFDKNNVKGEIHDHEWVNYGDARNHALKLAKDKADFCFTIDADNVLNIPIGFDVSILRNQLSVTNIGEIQASNGAELQYAKRSFWRNSKPFYYFGATHEVLMCEEASVLPTDIHGLTISVKSEGASWRDPKEKFRENIKLLTDYIDKNGFEPRHVFYLAESYKDAGELTNAILWYEKRTTLGGFYEEIYYSRLMVGKMKWRLNYPVYEIADEFMRCGELDDLRAEHLYELKLMYERNGRPKGALKIGELLRKYKNPYPQRMLFLNKLAYEYSADTAIAPTGYWKQEQADIGHIHSEKIAEFLNGYFEKHKQVIDAGCGLGFYLNNMKKAGFIRLLGIEGSKLSNFIFDGEIAIQDLTKKLELNGRRGNVISLEVGEHIPKEYEQDYLDNITSLCNNKLVISWAVVGQGGLGHVNEQPNEYIKAQIIKRGFTFVEGITDEMRKLPEDFCWYFRNTIMVFERNVKS